MANLEAWSRTMPLADEHGAEEPFASSSRVMLGSGAAGRVVWQENLLAAAR
jgi:hypothetical protein